MSKSIYRDEYRILVELLRETRERAGISQGEVARAFNSPQSTLSHIERGSRRLDLIEFIDYCHALGVAPQDLFDELLGRIEERLGGRVARK